VRGHGRARGAIAPALIFWFFCIKAKEQKEHNGIGKKNTIQAKKPKNNIHCDKKRKEINFRNFTFEEII